MQVNNPKIKALLENKKELSKSLVSVQKKVMKAQGNLNKYTTERNKIAQDLQELKDKLVPMVNKQVKLPKGEVVKSVDLVKGFVKVETTTIDEYIADTVKLAEENARKAWEELEKRS